MFLNYRTHALVALAALVCGGTPALAQINTGGGTDPLDGHEVVSIEEDWVIKIADADPLADCPQVCTVFGPDDPETGLHACFDMNGTSYPTFIRGGYQLSVWEGDGMRGFRRAEPNGNFCYAIEQVTFTTRSRLDGGFLFLEITNGESLSFGAFGDDTLTQAKLKTSRENLNAFNPEHSMDHSRVTYGANRVNAFYRAEVRYYDATGQLVHSDNNGGEPEYVHRLAEDEYAPDPVNGE